MLKKNKLNLFLTTALLAMPVAFAQPNAQGVFGNIFSSLNTLLANGMIRFGLVFISFFIILYGIYATGLRAVPAFKEGDELSKNGKLVAIGFTLISNVGIFVTTNGSPEQAVENILKAFGIYGTIFVSTIIFLMLYFALKDTEFYQARKWEMLLCMLGIALILGGTILPSEWWRFWGICIFTIGAFFFIFSLLGAANKTAGGTWWPPGGGGGGGGGPRAPRPVPNPVSRVKIIYDPNER